MYCLIDLQCQMLFIWCGDETEPQLCHGIVVSPQASAVNLSFVYALTARVQVFALLARHLPRSYCFKIPKIFCDFASTLRIGKLKALFSATKSFLKSNTLLKCLTAFFFTGLLFWSQTSRLIAEQQHFTEGYKTISPPISEAEAGLAIMQKAAFHAIASEKISPRASVLKEFKIIPTPSENSYQIFPLYDHFSRTLQITAELEASLVYVYTTSGQWEFLSPSLECHGRQHFVFSAKDKFLLILETDWKPHRSDSISIATFPMNYSGAFLCHAELQQGQ